MRHGPSSSRPAPTLLFLLLALGLLVACRASGAEPGDSSDVLPTGLVGPVAPTVGPEALRYVALGDSYTFGDGVRQRDRWPNQLVHVLRPELDLDLVANLAARSIASRDVVDEQLPDLQKLAPQFVSVQVGANDVCLFKAETPVLFAGNMDRILDAVLGLVDANRAVVLTIPDFTLAPATSANCAGDREEQAERIRALNSILVEAAGMRGIAVVDVAPIADLVPDDPSLVTSDGRYPSAKQYAGWADLAALTIRRLFHEPAGSVLATAEPTNPTPQSPSTSVPPTQPASEPPSVSSQT